MSRLLPYWLALFAAASASAQGAALVDVRAERVLGDRVERVKTDDGGVAERRSTLVYDPVAGQYVTTVADGTGRVLERTVQTGRMIGPTAAEAASAEAVVRTHPALRSALGGAVHPVTVSGGFPLVREAGHACGPRARCAMFDVYEVAPPSGPSGRSSAHRLRFVVVDLRTMRLVDPDFDAAVDGNFANPAVRARSRALPPR